MSTQGCVCVCVCACVCVCVRACVCVDLSKLLKQLNSLPLTKWKEGGGRGGGGREGKKGGRERVYVCLPLCATGKTSLIDLFLV